MKTIALVATIGLIAAAPEALKAQAGPVGGSGRFVIVHSPHVQRDTILLDTMTGKTWTLVSITSRGGAELWEPMARGDNSAELADWKANNPRTDGKQ